MPQRPIRTLYPPRVIAPRQHNHTFALVVITILTSINLLLTLNVADHLDRVGAQVTRIERQTHAAP